ncbi:MAG TPA: hypothetical protein VLA04_00255, partial [Verrucomicrobiae bacterium]|nr:hypothetical protein [Verrucomicrobiae bacterium]
AAQGVQRVGLEQRVAVHVIGLDDEAFLASAGVLTVGNDRAPQGVEVVFFQQVAGGQGLLPVTGSSVQ